MTAIFRRPSLLVAFCAASFAGLAVLLYAAHIVTMVYTVTFLAPLSAVLFVALVVRAGRGREEVLVNRLWGGFIAGVAGLIAYDLVRLVIEALGVPFDPFRPIEVYGLLILNQSVDTALTKAVGWAFHIWSGLSFAIMYTLTVGRGRMTWAVLWGMVLEVTMLVTYPSIFGLLADWAFVVVSSIGHLCYGLALGAMARRIVKW